PPPTTSPLPAPLTTHLSTLSLHDALPISISGTPTSAGSFPFTVQVTDTASHSASANLSVNVGNPVVSVAIASPANNANHGIAHVDRKSTRLNSSHVSISYAVFCLKKKNRK